ncbi:MAG TPA: bifunctional UDP-N-acetylmuramoyl-tripeptide:D-alanyl-D-alanine ligase/alanine racemase, partial [Chitinophagales bacterium]|nr:bifunctional UDP-N-acetylmuramoyl-tripeptide:D-alanyl-D-alanine ligase/alanine racemase [Chitinophagales bacterium]
LYQKGLRHFVISGNVEPLRFPEANFIRVKNTVLALQNLAAGHRKTFPIPVIGITGSNGKTIVKEWLYQLLEADYNIVRSPKSYNSQIGVPLSVWQMAPYHTLAVFEAGVSQPNEMADLEKVIQPTIGIFTNIGPAHDEGFLNIRQKINEKLKLFIHTEILIYCRDYMDLNECLVGLRDRMKLNDPDFNGFKTFSWSKTGLEADVMIRNVTKHPYYTEIEAATKKETFAFSIPFTDDASIENAIQCWMLMTHMGIDNGVIAQRMMNLNKIAMRLELKDGLNNCSLINDYYNSDINSLSIAIDFLKQQKKHPRHTVILSDILQSGVNDVELYGKVANLLKSHNVNRFIGIGKAIQRQHKMFQTEGLETQFYPNTDDFLMQFDLSQFNEETVLLKGARQFAFEKISKQLEYKRHETILEINLNALVHNLHTYQQLLKPETKTIVMVKAFSYGSGAFEIANVLQNQRVDYLAVAYGDEGIELRKAGILVPIMVMHPVERAYDALLFYQLEPVVFNTRTLTDFLAVLRHDEKNRREPFAIHLEVETGMHRLGFEEQHIDDLLVLLNDNKKLVQVKSVFSHLAGSDDAVFDGYTRKQIETFERIAEKLEEGLGHTVIKHLLNSAGIVRFPEAQFDMVRLGIGLYGIDATNDLNDKLRNVSTLKTLVTQLKHLKAGDSVGYSRKGMIQRDSVIATVGIGYADGLRRSLSNGVGKMMVRGRVVPIVGNVCMDMCMIDVTDVPRVEEGDEVIVFGDDLSPAKLAEWSGTISYEILSTISQRVKRVYYQE